MSCKALSDCATGQLCTDRVCADSPEKTWAIMLLIFAWPCFAVAKVLDEDKDEDDPGHPAGKAGNGLGAVMILTGIIMMMVIYIPPGDPAPSACGAGASGFVYSGVVLKDADGNDVRECVPTPEMICAMVFTFLGIICCGCTKVVKAKKKELVEDDADYEDQKRQLGNVSTIVSLCSTAFWLTAIIMTISVYTLGFTVEVIPGSSEAAEAKPGEEEEEYAPSASGTELWAPVLFLAAAAYVAWKFRACLYNTMPCTGTDRQMCPKCHNTFEREDLLR